MKFALLVLLLLPSAFMTQAQEQLTVYFADRDKSSPDCKRIYLANGRYAIRNQELNEVKLPNTTAIKPAELSTNDLISFHSFSQKAESFGFIELDEYQIDSISGDQVMELFRNSEDSAYAHWFIRNDSYLWENFGIVVSEEHSTEYRIGDSVIANPDNIKDSGRIIDGIYVIERKFSKIEPLNREHFPVDYESKSEKARGQVQPLLDSLLRPFYFSNYEVTNREYREFIDYVKDSIELRIAYDNLGAQQAVLLLNCSKKELKLIDPANKYANLERFGLTHRNRKKIEDTSWWRATESYYYPMPERFYKRREVNAENLSYSYGGKKIPVYPDTTGFLKVEGIGTHGGFLSNLTWHPAFMDYPIVNVNEEQIMAFCYWKERRLNEVFRSKGFKVIVRPPTIMEYEFATKTSLGPEGYYPAVDQSNQNFIPFEREHVGAEFLFYQSVYYNPFDKKLAKMNRMASLNYKLWYKANQSTSPIKFLNGNVSEFVLDEVTPDKIAHYKLDSTESKSNAHFVMGSNYIQDVKTQGDDQYNAIFYKTTLENGTSSPLVGFRLVYLVERIPN